MRRHVAFLITAVAVCTPALAQEPAPTRGGQVHASLSDGHPRFRIGELRVDLRGRVQADFDSPEASANDPDDADVTRIRAGIEGRLRSVAFEIDVAPGDERPMRDMWAEYRIGSGLRIRAGQLKIPFGREATTSGGELDFAQRAQLSKRLAPGRDRGVIVHGRLLRQVISYEAGAFVADGTGRRILERDETDGGRAAAWRVTLQPFARSTSPLAHIGVGAAWTRSHQDEGISNIDVRSASGERVVSPSFWVHGARRRTGLDARWEPGPVSVAVEYLELHDERRGQGIAGEDLPPLVGRAWYVAGGWLLTGESTRGIVRPRAPFLRGGAGAFELTARFERFGLGDMRTGSTQVLNPRATEIPGSRQDLATAGLTWYPNRWIKVQANLIHESFADTAGIRRGADSASWSRIVRLQVAM